MKILIVSRDAGGAELVSSWVRQNPHNKYRFVLDDPAISIFEEKLNGIENHLGIALNQLIQESDLVLTGSSESSDFEKRAIQKAILSNTKSATFLDYWFGFRKRFMLNGNLTLPDEIWVGDRYAARLAERELPESKIVLKPNPYLKDLKKEKEKIEEQNYTSYDGTRFLYLCQPYFQEVQLDDGKTTIITAESGLELFFTIMASNVPFKGEIRIRQHPSEISGAYLGTICAFSDRLTITMSQNNSLARDLTWADVAVGMHAQALAIGVEFGLNVFYCIPDGGSLCALPHKEIKDFRFCAQQVLFHRE